MNPNPDDTSPASGRQQSKSLEEIALETTQTICALIPRSFGFRPDEVEPIILRALQAATEEQQDENKRLRGEIRKAVNDWHRFHDFLIAGNGPEEFFRLRDVERKNQGVIEKFMDYVSSLWRELADLRSQLDAARQQERSQR